MKKRYDIVAAIISFVAIFSIVGIIADGAPGKRHLGGESVLPGVWDPSDGKLYVLRAATDSMGILLVAHESSASGTISPITLTPAAPVLLVAASSQSRMELMIQNAPFPYSSDPVYIGTSATVTDFDGANPGLQAVPGDTYHSVIADNVYVSCPSTCTVVVQEVEQ